MDHTEAVPIAPTEIMEPFATQAGMPALAWSQTEPAFVQQRPSRRGWAWAFWGVLGVGAVALTAVVATHPTRTTSATSRPDTITSIPGATQTNTSPPPFTAPTATAERLVPPAPAPTPLAEDQRYLQLLNDDGWDVNDANTAINAGHAACANLALTHNLYDTTRWVQAQSGSDFDRAESVVTAAAVVYCPGTPG